MAGGDIYVRVFRIYLEMAPRPEQVLKQVLMHERASFLKIQYGF